MKSVIATTKVISLTATILFGSTSFADLSAKKESTKIDFNSMIDANNVKRNQLQEEISKTASMSDQEKRQQTNKADDAQADSDKSKVVDFINLEVGFGQTPNIGRRYDSVGDIKVVDLETLQNK